MLHLHKWMLQEWVCSSATYDSYALCRAVKEFPEASDSTISSFCASPTLSTSVPFHNQNMDHTVIMKWQRLLSNVLHIFKKEITNQVILLLNTKGSQIWKGKLVFLLGGESANAKEKIRSLFSNMMICHMGMCYQLFTYNDIGKVNSIKLCLQSSLYDTLILE